MSMFSVDINSANGANYIRPKKGVSQKTTTARTPVDMTKDGSVFNDPNIFSTNNQPSILSLRNSRRATTTGQRGGNSIFNGQMNFVSGGTNGTSSTGGTSGGINTLTSGLDTSMIGGNDAAETDDLGIGRDATKGRAAAEELDTQTSDLRGGINDVESREDEASSISKKSVKLQKSIKKNDDKFKEKDAKQQAEFKKLEEERRAVMMEMDAANKSIDEYSAELEAEIASGSGNFEKIATLRNAIREKSSTITIGQSKINVIGRSSKALVNEMNRTAKAYVKTNKANQKDLDKNQTKLEKTLEVAQDIEEISTIVETTGSIIENLGRVFKACAGIPFVGAALAAAGAVMEPIGTTGKTVGQWGKTAAKLTQTVAYASAGMVQAAFMSAASAVQSGMSAVQSTKQMTSQWKNLDNELKSIREQADAANTKGTAAADKADELEETQGAKDADDAGKVEGKEGTEATDSTQAPDDTAPAEGTDSAAETGDTAGVEGTEGADGAKGTEGVEGTEETPEAKGTEGAKGKDVETDDAADVKTAKKDAAEVRARTESRAKSTLRKIFSKEGLANVGQAMQLAGSIVAMVQGSQGQAEVPESKVRKEVYISDSAKKIVADIMPKMGYSAAYVRQLVA